MAYGLSNGHVSDDLTIANYYKVGIETRVLKNPGTRVTRTFCQTRNPGLGIC